MEDLLFMIDISRLAGCSQAAAWNWLRRHRDFPRPCGIRRGQNSRLSIVFDRTKIIHWLARHGKIDSVEGVDSDNQEIQISQNDEPVLRPFSNEMAIQFLTGNSSAETENYCSSHYPLSTL